MHLVYSTTPANWAGIFYGTTSHLYIELIEIIFIKEHFNVIICMP